MNNILLSVHAIVIYFRRIIFELLIVVSLKCCLAVLISC